MNDGSIEGPEIGSVVQAAWCRISLSAPFFSSALPALPLQISINRPTPCPLLLQILVFNLTPSYNTTNCLPFSLLYSILSVDDTYHAYIRLLQCIIPTVPWAAPGI